MYPALMSSIPKAMSLFKNKKARKRGLFTKGQIL